ncbi:MAG: phosphatidylserine decarboxylase family protein [candidate division Zixibacteria bacterium]|nr:phosphatidylserine decarboxylase family protein [candidate division Zixibacteria bacterium]
MIVKDGWPFILIALVLTVVLLLGALKWDSLLLIILSSLLAVITLFMAFFFRNPDRIIPDVPLSILASADGRIVKIESFNHPYVDGPATRISIFLSVFDVHVNRVPVSGIIDYVKYNPGKFFPAFEDKASDLNEQTEIGLTMPEGQRLVFTQIAGILARRIVCNLKKGDTVSAGERFGMIRFGSRCDIILPEESTLKVKIGDRVKGGTTIIGYLPAPADNQHHSDGVTEDNVKL